jgi:hypothetical protein
MSSSQSGRPYDDLHPLAQARARQQRENWIDQAIREGQERGEFDNLSGTGKPQAFDSNPHGADWESGFRVLKNAGMAPAWIEIDKEIRALRERMTDLTERTAAFIAENTAPTTPKYTELPARTSLRTRLARLWDGERSRAAASQPTGWDLDAFRQRARREYLQNAADLDRKLVEYNGALPEGLWWKERSRLPQEQAEREFDADVPKVVDA